MKKMINTKWNVQFVVAMLILIAVLGTCKKNPVDSLNLKKEHPGLGLEELQTSAITYKSVTVKVNASTDGGEAITERGFIWNTEGNPTVIDNKLKASGSGTGQFSETISGLWGSTDYAIKAYVINKTGTFYSTELKVTTSESIPAKVTTGEPFEISAFSAKVVLNIPDNGGRPILEKGIAIGTSPDPTFSTSIAEKEEIELVFDETKKLKPLKSKQETNRKQILEKEINHSKENKPELEEEQKASNSSQTETPTLTDENEEVVELKNLIPGTTYYIRAYVKTELGTSYGEEKTFTTRDGKPILTTNAITEIRAKSALSGGVITNDEGFTITQKGLVWSTNPDPTLSDSKTEQGSGNASFVVTLPDLFPNTVYYVRSYATNSVGTGYGNEQSFTTRDGIIVLTTNDITEITSTSAQTGGNITEDGGSSITERGIVWSTIQNPTTSANQGKIISRNETGSFSETISNLTAETSYYVRVYAINELGTRYGNEISFSTLFDPNFTNSIGMEFVYIEPGSFYMGSTVGDGDEQPVHQVTLTQGFYMGKYEVTQKQWVEIMGSNPSSSSYGLGDNYPVNQVSWNDIQTFVTKLNEKEGENKYRLPTEAEWEFCAQAGTAANGEGPRWHFGNDESQLVNYAWYSSNSGSRSHEVGTKLPNQYGLYDMHGNVWEWVQDWYGTYSSSNQTDSTGPSSGSNRVGRGGSWDNSAGGTRSAFRNDYSPDSGLNNLGFRLVRLQ